MSEQNKEVVRRIEEAWDRQNLDALDQHFGPNFSSHAGVPGLPPGLKGAKLAHGMAMQSFPDRKMRIQHIVADGDKVVVWTRMTGTNQGGVQWIGAPANGKPVDIESVSVYRFENGKAVEHWGLNDVATLMMQTGVIPMPGGATAAAPA
jgi:predicted ester cyclase